MIITHRPRRLRNSGSIRELMQEFSLRPKDLIQPLFVVEGKNKKQKIEGLGDNCRLSIDNLVKKVEHLYSLGIRAILLFPCIDTKLKNDYAPEAINPDNLICRAIKDIKNKVPQMIICGDVALDPYTIHGHDGILTKDGKDIDNDTTLSILTRQAKILAVAGADIVCPSDMMDGRVDSIRNNLEEYGLINTKIASYATKYASNLYGPFRAALGVEKLTGPVNKKTYQMDFSNKKEALIEAELDIAEGSDILIVKPAGFYLDIIQDLVGLFPTPIWGYQVSGEYQMIQSMPNATEIMIENLIAIKRSGAQNIICYSAEQIAGLL